MAGYKFEGSNVAKDIAERFGYSGDLAQLFTKNDGPIVNKWHHYLGIYDRYFSAYRGTSVKFLEIGVAAGGSLELWREFFGPKATIYGIDINPACAQFDGQHGQVRIGSQDDQTFLDRVVDEMGGVDVILDDGSHVMSHIHASLRYLFPKLSTPGLYMIEDLHTAFWKKWGGGYDAQANFFNTVNAITRDMHHWYHQRAAKHPPTARFVSGVHVHDSIVVLEKSKPQNPVYSIVGQP